MKIVLLLKRDKKVFWGLCWGPPILGNYHLQERACVGCFCGCFPNMN